MANCPTNLPEPVSGAWNKSVRLGTTELLCVVVAAPALLSLELRTSMRLVFGSTHPIVISVTVVLTGTVPATRVYVNHK